jgi:hypothetical protein
VAARQQQASSHSTCDPSRAGDSRRPPWADRHGEPETLTLRTAFGELRADNEDGEEEGEEEAIHRQYFDQTPSTDALKRRLPGSFESGQVPVTPIDLRRYAQMLLQCFFARLPEQ